MVFLPIAKPAQLLLLDKIDTCRGNGFCLGSAAIQPSRPGAWSGTCWARIADVSLG
jgi:hypothetical protein